MFTAARASSSSCASSSSHASSSSCAWRLSPPSPRNAYPCCCCCCCCCCCFSCHCCALGSAFGSRDARRRCQCRCCWSRHCRAHRARGSASASFCHCPASPRRCRARMERGLTWAEYPTADERYELCAARADGRAHGAHPHRRAVDRAAVGRAAATAVAAAPAPAAAVRAHGRPTAVRPRRGDCGAQCARGPATAAVCPREASRFSAAAARGAPAGAACLHSVWA